MCAKFSKSVQISAIFTLGMIANETGHLLECVELHGKFIYKNETWHMNRRNIAASWLKILWIVFYFVICYDESNINVFTLGQWEVFWWGLIYFDQFT